MKAILRRTHITLLFTPTTISDFIMKNSKDIAIILTYDWQIDKINESIKELEQILEQLPNQGNRLRKIQIKK